MEDLEIIWILLALSLVFIGYLVWLNRRRAVEFVDGLQADPELVAELTGVWRAVSVRHRDPQLPTEARTIMRGRQNKIPYWQVRVTNVSLGRQTSLRLAVEGVIGHAREAIGFHDVHVGIEDFDHQFNVRGEDPDRIRRVLQDPALREAITTFFTPTTVHRCRLDRDGNLTVELRRRGLDAKECREAIRRTRALAEALDRAGQ